jgi:hypothetical protein
LFWLINVRTRLARPTDSTAPQHPSSLDLATSTDELGSAEQLRESPASSSMSRTTAFKLVLLGMPLHHHHLVTLILRSRLFRTRLDHGGSKLVLMTIAEEVVHASILTAQANQRWGRAVSCFDLYVPWQILGVGKVVWAEYSTGSQRVFRLPASDTFPLFVPVTDGDSESRRSVGTPRGVLVSAHRHLLPLSSSGGTSDDSWDTSDLC